MAIGFAVLVAGVLGLISLFAGNPSFTEGWTGDESLSEAGGAIGALAAWPLARVISPIGAAIVCAGLASLGLLIFTGTPFAAVKEKFDSLREERDERDPVAARAKDSDHAKPRRRWSLREAFGLTDDVIHLPEADDGHEAAHRDDRVGSAGPCVPLRAGAPGDERLSLAYRQDPVRAVPAPPAGPVPDGASLQRGLARGEGHAGRTRADPAHVRRRRPGRGGAPRSHRHDVRGRGGFGHQGEQGRGALERHLVRARLPGRPDPGTDPGQIGDRDRGSEHPSGLRDGGRRVAFARRRSRRPIRSRSHSARTSMAARGW